jgi:hypothetical protein
MARRVPPIQVDRFGSLVRTFSPRPPEIRCTCNRKVAECDSPRLARRAGLVIRCPKCGRMVRP